MNLIINHYTLCNPENGETRMNKNEQNVREMCIMKCINICEMGVPEEEDKMSSKNNYQTL